MKDNFDRCMEHVFQDEGGYVDHPSDPGGATNMGITHLTLSAWRGHRVSKEDVRNLTKREAKDIYRNKYWNAVKGDDLPYGLDLVAFDGAVNSGPHRGATWLQRALGVAQDGVIGPETLRVSRKASPVNIINRACTYRLDFLRNLKNWGTFGNGWQRRVDGVRSEALKMARLDEKPVSNDGGQSSYMSFLKWLISWLSGKGKQ